MPFQLVNQTNITGFVSIVQYANNVTDGWYGPGALIALFIVSFVAMKAFTTERALTAASFITAICAILMSSIGILSNNVLVPVLVLGTLSLIWLIGKEG